MMIDSAISYIEKSFSIKITEMELKDLADIPIYLNENYTFRKIEMLDQYFMLICKNSSEETNIDIIQKHFLKFRSSIHSEEKLILILDHVSHYLIKQLVKERISFVIPGKQIFILELGTIFNDRQRPNYSIVKETSVNKMPPSTQALFLYLMTTNDFSSSMEEIAKILRMTKMSISRGFSVLKDLNIIERSKNVDNSVYCFCLSRKETWVIAQKSMINPVLKTIYVHKNTFDSKGYEMLLVSGELALSMHSMLSSPQTSVYGITNKLFKATITKPYELPINDKDSIAIQLFTHVLQAVDGILHPLSIALVLMDEKDERVREEIKQMLLKYFESIDDK